MRLELSVIVESLHLSFKITEILVNGTASSTASKSHINGMKQN